MRSGVDKPSPVSRTVRSPLFPSGKRERQSLDAAGPPLPRTKYVINSVSPTFFVNDRRTGRKYLVDLGAAVSIFPASPEDRRRLSPDDTTLSAANGSAIRSYGKRTVPLVLGKASRSFLPEFIVADVTHPILGADFFERERLGIDLWRRRLWDLDRSDWAWSGGVTPDGAETIVCSVHSTESNNCSFRAILDEFPDIQSSDFHSEINKHGIQHYVLTSGPPLHSCARRLDEAKLASAKAEFAKMEKEGIVRRSNSPWASPLHCVPKPDGTFRPCGDYCRLNSASQDDRYPLPFIADFTANLKGAAIFSKIDLRKAYHQI